ncbi:MAG TPA: hypothetical protein DCS07_09055 [Bdellovibrionales bacterium]|nr:MAG: hypothetical protein A2Z97_12110 [Bdellovibrionales bacterium GWB1_52_6]OFZ06024.1 MAG: hypothetical protein A2X97_01665 [Bdellovibrionales bacterium GWA1_52_35]OFZ39852.1 MAG: hypothetical protein A2070_03350 [Bdellovibrionales bacterium GWC1_52_8]HAR42758.1 hypothetical protein [Bdellovibrionales bacterium]HCM39351.1 hypothetical protein [Bdellovibrionales bacterium]
MKLLINHPIRLLLATVGALVFSSANSYARTSSALEPDCAALYTDILRNSKMTANACRPGDSPRADTEANIARIMNRAVCDGKIKDAVVLIGNSKGILYEKGFNTGGKVDGVYDLASLTKPIATATAVMKLIEESHGSIRLEDPISKHIPHLKGKGLDSVTIGDLLRHRAKIAEIDGKSAKAWKGLSKDASLERAALIIAKQTRARRNHLEQFQYRDSAYVLLAELLQEKTGNFEKYVQTKVLNPIGMTNSRFRANPGDLLARSLQGSGGNAGLFSTAQDLSKYAQMLLSKQTSALSPASQRLMTEASAQDKARFAKSLELLKKKNPSAFLNPDERPELHSTGFDLDPLSLKGLSGFSDKAFGHTGSSGTSMLIDPEKDLYVIILARNSMVSNTPEQKKRSAQAIGEIRRTVGKEALDLADTEGLQLRMQQNCRFSPDISLGAIRIIEESLPLTTGSINSSGAPASSAPAKQ